LGVTFFALTRLNRRQFLGEPAKRKTSCNPKDIAATQVSTVAIFEHCLGEGPELYITAQYAGNGFSLPKYYSEARVAGLPTDDPARIAFPLA